MLNVFVDPFFLEEFEKGLQNLKKKIYLSPPQKDGVLLEAWDIVFLSEMYNAGEFSLELLKETFPFCELFVLPSRFISPGLQRSNLFTYSDARDLVNNAHVLIENLLHKKALESQLKSLLFSSQPFFQGPQMRLFLEKLARARHSPLPLLLVSEPGIDRQKFAQFLFPERKVDRFSPRDLDPSLQSLWLKGDAIAPGFLEVPHQCVFFDDWQDFSEPAQLLLFEFAMDPKKPGTPPSMGGYPVVFGAEQSGLSRTRDFFQTFVIPPLRERSEDILFVFPQLVSTLSAKMGKEVPLPDEKLMELLKVYPWPQNEEQMQRLAEHYVISGSGAVAEMMGKELELVQFSQQVPDLNAFLAAMKGSLEKTLIQRAMDLSGQNRKKAASMLRISYKALCNKLRYL
ncbi:MAG TPA: helix-turn-helix domain-containing protein [Thermotogota bacterium]|nr:helix-turn-helix domain-containing protein [Thermotogota bacterium]HRW91599.1 helix-turn-helix domain-containing protein [Thermotogota bacterium]